MRDQLSFSKMALKLDFNTRFEDGLVRWSLVCCFSKAHSFAIACFSFVFWPFSRLFTVGITFWPFRPNDSRMVFNSGVHPGLNWVYAHMNSGVTLFTAFFIPSRIDANKGVYSVNITQKWSSEISSTSSFTTSDDVIAIAIHFGTSSWGRNGANFIFIEIFPKRSHLTGHFTEKIDSNRFQIGCPRTIYFSTSPTKIPTTSTFMCFDVQILKIYLLLNRVN